MIFSDLLGSAEAIAAARIVQWWRRCSTRLEARHTPTQKRAHTIFQKPECQAEWLINEILVDWMRSRDTRRGNIYIIRDSGFLLLTNLLKLQRLIKMTHTKAVSTLTDSTDVIKLGLRETVTLLEKRERSLATYTARFEDIKGVQVLFELPTNKLKERMDRDLKALESYRKEVEIWAREIEDCLADTWSETNASNAWTVWFCGGSK